MVASLYIASGYAQHLEPFVISFLNLGGAFTVYQSENWKLRAEGASQLGHCNSTCVIHVRTTPYQHAIKVANVPFPAGWIGSGVDPMHVCACNQEGFRSDILHQGLAKLVNLIHILCLFYIE